MKINCNETLAVSLHRVFNADLNEHGTVFGGRILELVDGEASVAAMRVTRSTVVTAAMDHVQFLKPFQLQDSMCMEAYVTGVGHRSLEVFVKVIGEHLMTGERFVGFSCFMTYVIQDPKKSNPVRPIDSTNSRAKSNGSWLCSSSPTSKRKSPKTSSNY